MVLAVVVAREVERELLLLLGVVGGVEPDLAVVLERADEHPVADVPEASDACARAVEVAPPTARVGLEQARVGADGRRRGASSRDVAQRLLDLARVASIPLGPDSCAAPGTAIGPRAAAPRRGARRGDRACRVAIARAPRTGPASAGDERAPSARSGARSDRGAGARQLGTESAGGKAAGATSGARLSCAAPRAVKLGGSSELASRARAAAAVAADV